MGQNFKPLACSGRNDAQILEYEQFQLFQFRLSVLGSVLISKLKVLWFTCHNFRFPKSWDYKTDALSWILSFFVVVEVFVYFFTSQFFFFKVLKMEGKEQNEWTVLGKMAESFEIVRDNCNSFIYLWLISVFILFLLALFIQDLFLCPILKIWRF